MRTPETVNVYNILARDRQYVIPVYQRIYTWEAAECNRLWDDIVKMHQQGKKSHFIGTIVNISEDTEAFGITEFMIIDGQQRLTTLTLLLLALRDYFATRPDPERLREKIENSYLIHRDYEGDKRYRLLLSKTDHDELIGLIEKTQSTTNQNSRILKNYNLFKDKLQQNVLTPNQLCRAIERLIFVNITLDKDKDDAQAIFESLNSTGVKLEDSDLIRNYLLMKLKSRDQKIVYDIYWYRAEKLFGYERQSATMNNFFRAFLTMKLGRIPNIKEIYEEFKTIDSNVSIEDRCKEILRYAKIYTDMYFVRADDPKLRKLYEEIKKIQMEVVYPFLMELHVAFDDGKISIEELREIITLCISYVLRRVVCGYSSNSHSETFVSISKAIRQDDYLNSVKAFFVLQSTAKEFPNDERFFESFVSRDIYNMSGKRCSYILGRLENWNNHSVVSPDNLTIEHIVPLEHNGGTLPECWQEMLGENWESIWGKYVNTIGNLTFTSYNSEMSDSPFDRKLTMEGGFRQSALRLNSYVVEQTEWKEIQIRERAQKLGEIAVKAWPYPMVAPEKLAEYRELQNIQRERASTICITFEDGLIINERRASETLVKFIQKVGPERVVALGITRDSQPLIIQSPSTFRHPAQGRDLGNGMAVNTHSSTSDKCKLIEQIAVVFGIKVKVEKKMRHQASGHASTNLLLNY